MYHGQLSSDVWLMSVIQVDNSVARRLAIFESPVPEARIASGYGPEAINLAQRISKIGLASPSLDQYKQDKGSVQGSRQRSTQARNNVAESLYDTLAGFKVRTASVAMHMDNEWRSKLFAQLDSLLDSEEWDPSDIPPTLNSFSTLIRMLLSLRPERRPGLAASPDGHMVATWLVEKDRLTIECLDNDEVRWVLARKIDGETERAAGQTVVTRLKSVLSPYDAMRWFSRAINIHSR